MLPVSVIIPARNEADNIAKLIQSLKGQTTPPAEIIVVDAGSSDDTAAIAAQAGARVIKVDRAYPGQARNIGIAHATYDIIACWDASMRVAPDALEKLIQPLLAGTAEMTSGHLEILPQGWTTSIYLLLLMSPYNHVLPGGKVIYAHPVACNAFYRSLWERVGGLRPWRAREDSDFRQRVLALKPRLQYVPESITYWEPDEDWGKLLRKVRLYGRHNLLSGKPSEWYGGLVRVYGAYLLLSLGVGVGYGVSWGLFMLIGATIIGGILRTLRKILQNGALFTQKTGHSPFAPSVLLSAVLILLSTDMASFAGALDWLVLDKLGLEPERFPQPQIIGELSPQAS
ncbi:MAG: glycosyltransferase [Bacteroidia bacterium]|nr:glycosyltransferase [Bacteroidia bacterium]